MPRINPEYRKRAKGETFAAVRTQPIYYCPTPEATPNQRGRQAMSELFQPALEEELGRTNIELVRVSANWLR